MNSKRKTSEFMDKQIMDLSSSPDFTPPMNNHQLIGGDDGLEEMVPSYDFHPIRPTTTLPLPPSDSLYKPLSTLSSNKGVGSLDSIEPTKLVPDNLLGTTILSEIDRTMKKHADTLLHVMDGVTARLTHLETRTHNVEHLFHDLNVSVHKCHDLNMTQIQNILVELQSGVQLLKDKHELFEAQLQLSKLQVSKEDQHPKTHSPHVDPTAQSPAPLTPQQMPQFPPTSFPQTPSSAASLSQQSLHPPSSQLPAPFSPQQDPYCPQLSHSQPPPPNQLPYLAPPPGYIPEEHPSYAAHSYSPNHPPQHPPAGSAPSQHLYNAPQPPPSMYHGAAGGRSNSSFPPGYSPESYTFTGSPLASAKPPHMSGSGANYPQLSNSRPLPHALPMAAATSSGSSSPRSESRVPIDDVIDRVTTMGFPRDQVRATVRKLTENGQAVDLNVVLDKLMNEGGGAWFGFGGQ